MTILRDAELYSRLRGLLQSGWMDLPDEPGYRGTGAPGKMLEYQLGLDGSNYDSPDSGRWEIKFHSGSALLTLFHLEGQPRGHMNLLVRRFGWPDKNGRTSFRHTIHGQSDRGFYVVNEGNRIIVRNDADENFEWPYWTHDRLINAFVAKFRRLIVVHGSKQRGRVRYNTAKLYWEPQTTSFVQAVQQGVIAIDFDARTTEGRGLRNHGTKFRVRYEDLYQLYHRYNDFA